MAMLVQNNNRLLKVLQYEDHAKINKVSNEVDAANENAMEKLQRMQSCAKPSRCSGLKFYEADRMIKRQA